MKHSKKFFTKGILFLLLILSGIAYSQESLSQHSVSGFVKDNKGEAVIGAAVQVKGTSIGAITNLEGAYVLNTANPNVTLTFTYLGFITQEIALGGRNVLNVTLVEDSEELDEVVVVGYGTQRKSSLTSAVSQIDGKELAVTPSTNLTSILGGRLPGVTSVQESGQPGADQAGLLIRGSRAGVLYIVDGVPRSIDDVNPDDVASVSVLKDASASAVYGLDAAGGVIIITTKKGTVGKTKLTYSGSYGISSNTNYPEFLDGPNYAWYYNKGLELDGNQPIFTEDHIKMMLNDDPNDGWGNTNWIKEVFGTGHTQKHNVTLNGGNERASYYTSLAFMDQTGNVDKFGYKRYNLRTNLEAKIFDNLKMTVGISGIRGERRSPTFSAGGGEGSGYADGAEWMSIARQAVNSHPYIPIKYNDMYTASPNTISQPSNPLAALDGSGKNQSTSMVLQTNLALEWDIPWVKGLSAKFSGSYDYSSTTSKNLSTPYYMMLMTPPSATKPDISYHKVIDPRNNTTINLLEGLNKTDRLVGQLSLNYNTSINNTHNIDVMVLGEAQDMKNNSFSAQVENINFAELPELSLGKPNSQGNPIVGASRVSRSMGLVYRLRYDYLNKYLVEVSGRYDGSHKFAGNISGKRWGFFPAGSLGWRISEEEFMEDVLWVDNLKIRGGAGLLGNSGGTSINEFAFLSTYIYNTSPIVLNGKEMKAMYPSLVANLDLTWERVRTTNIGFDVSVLRGMLSWEFDYFYNYNYDIIGAAGADMPPSMGGHFPTKTNRNRSESRGIDMVFNFQHKVDLANKPFHYGAKLNITYAKNKWLRFNDSENAPDYQKLVGKPVGAQMIYIAEGLFRTEEEIDNAAWRKNTRPRLGDIKYKDLNGDNVIDEKDKGYFGRSNRPQLTAGLTLIADWNGFDINVMFTGAAKADVSLASTYYNGSDDTTILTRLFKSGANSPVYLAEGAWRPDNPNGEYPRLSVNQPTNDNGYASSFWIRDGKYLRLKSFQFGYTLPKNLTMKASMESVRIYVEGSNLFTWSGLPQGIDPEMPRVTNAYYPQQKTYMAGLIVTF